MKNIESYFQICHNIFNKVRAKGNFPAFLWDLRWAYSMRSKIVGKNVIFQPNVDRTERKSIGTFGVFSPDFY